MYALNGKLKGVHSAVNQIQFQIPIPEKRQNSTKLWKLSLSLLQRASKSTLWALTFSNFWGLHHFLIGWLVLSVHFLPVKLQQNNNTIWASIDEKLPYGKKIQNWDFLLRREPSFRNFCHQKPFEKVYFPWEVMMPGKRQHCLVVTEFLLNLTRRKQNICRAFLAQIWKIKDWQKVTSPGNQIMQTTSQYSQWKER